MRFLIPVILCVLAGCSDSMVSSDPARNNPLQPKGTHDIEEFKGDREVVQPKIRVTNPVTGPLEAFEPMKQRIAQFPIEQSMNLFHALEGRYPKDHDEFMQRIIKENKMQLPQPAKGFAYQYDVANHTLVVVRDTADTK